MTNLTTQNGMLSIESKNIFTILKKWLYTEQDIVFRELISNACDAIEKLSTLNTGDPVVQLEKGKILVKLDRDQKTLTIGDNGIGMSREEVHKYINQIAFSGASEFINKNNNAGKNTIIGHFGVGFYSSFMLADHVALETKSYQEEESAVRWDCMSDMSYQMEYCQKTEVGTEVMLYLEDSSPYLEKPGLVLDIIKKYFIFSKTPIYFDAPGYDQVLVNDPAPIWRLPKELVNEEAMNSFYKEFFQDVSAPMFWLQFGSVDIGVRGILFFRDTKNGTEELDGTIKVYNRGVYVGENIPELIPKFVNLQSGIIECDHLPLVVSRSTLREEDRQEGTMELIYECLSQEVTIAFHDMFENHRDQYEANWPNLNAFVKYGVLQDKIFASVMTRKVIFMDILGNYQTIQEYADTVAAAAHPDTIYYSSDALEQAHYIEIFKRCKLNALLFDHVIDQPFMRKYEVARPNLKFIRIDSNIESLFLGYMNPGDDAKAGILKDKISRALGDRLHSMTIKITNLEQESISTLIINDEKSRRMADMLEIYGFLNPTDVSLREIQAKSTLLINMNNDIIRYLLGASDEIAIRIVMNQLFDLALMSQQALKPEDVESFITRSESLLASAIGHEFHR
ncbi:MAG TPA: molecular chaperone HtpG [Clostridiales bacterium]|nr:molecular chaperone HtpG [Clostridiales bacterium]